MYTNTKPHASFRPCGPRPVSRHGPWKSRWTWGSVSSMGLPSHATQIYQMV